MRTLKLSSPVVAFFEALVAIGNAPPQSVTGWGGYTYLYLPISLPAVPTPDPVNTEEVAFFNGVAMPLYNALAAAAAIGTSIANQTALVAAPSPTAVSSGQQVYDAMIAQGATVEDAALAQQQTIDSVTAYETYGPGGAGFSAP